MQIIKTITENEFVAIFLQEEIVSVRNGAPILAKLKTDGADMILVNTPDTTNSNDNEYRLSILQEVRGYKRNAELFHNFPEDIVWQRAFVTKEELANVKYIDYDYWIELSGGSRLPTEAAKNINAGIEIFNVKNDNVIAAAKTLEKGNVFPPLILVGKSPEEYLVVLEGNVRLTAYFLAIDYLPVKLEVILGFSKDIEKWGLY